MDGPKQPELKSMENQSDQNNPTWVNNEQAVVHKTIDTSSVFSNHNNKTLMVKPKRNACHNFFLFIQILGALGNLTMITVQVVPLFICDKMSLLQIAVR